MKSFRFLLILPLALLVTACGTIAAGGSQEVTLRTPGTELAECTMDNGLRYTISTDQTIILTRSQKDIFLDCYASGNRRKTVVVESGINGWTTANVANGIIPGVLIDHTYKGMYQYPDVITVDFTGMPAHGYEMPNYHDKDGQNPYDQGIESYNATLAQTPWDKQYTQVGMPKRDPVLNNNPFATTIGSGSSSVTAAPLPAASAPRAIVPRGTTTQELNRSMNPNAFKN